MTGPSDDGQAGVTVTDADRAAALSCGNWRPHDYPHLADDDRWMVDNIAAALAAEREKARAPFLALIHQAGRTQLVSADRIRQAAEEGQQ